MTGLYHKDVFFPAQLNRLCQRGIIRLTLSQHAIRAMRDDRYGYFSIPKCLDTKQCQVIEAELSDGKLVKAVYRTSFDSTYDVCIVVSMLGGVVRTAWLNHKNDSHKTLDKRKYVQ